MQPGRIEPLTSAPAQAKKRIKEILPEPQTVSGVTALAKPRRIKASHRRRRKAASDHLLYILNNPLSGTDPTGYAADCPPEMQVCALSQNKLNALASEVQAMAKGGMKAGDVADKKAASKRSLSDAIAQANRERNGASSGQRADGAEGRKNQAAAAGEKNAAVNSGELRNRASGGGPHDAGDTWTENEGLLSGDDGGGGAQSYFDGDREPLYCDSGADCDFLHNQNQFLKGKIDSDTFLRRTEAQGAGGVVGGVTAIVLVAGGYAVVTYSSAGATVSETILVSRWGSAGLKSGDWVMKGGRTPWNYFWSGKWQPGLGNQFAPFSSGAQYLVPRSTLAFPNESALFNWIKAALGQRIYLPPPPP